MPIATRTAHVIVVACLVVAGLLALSPGAASALEPPRPLPGYRPAFVTETDTRPWIDCLWASGAMLIDKWTNGEITISHGRLRHLSGDNHRGSTLANLRTAYAKLGIDLAYSPDGGARITWGGLLNRLAHGGGAVLLGDDTRLPRWYGRWDHRFWKGKSKSTSHAVYIERYDRRHGRVWLMDPLARGDWSGEWISIVALRRFAWSSGGLVSAAMTPKARPAPFAKVRSSGADLIASPTTIDAAWDLRAPRGWRYPGADAHASFERAGDPLLAAITLPAPAPLLPPVASISAAGVDGQGSGGPATNASDTATTGNGIDTADVSGEPGTDQAGSAGRPGAPTVSMDGGRLRVRAALPVAAGAYVARLKVTDRRLGHTVVDSGRVAVFVPGSRQASIGVAIGERTAGAGSMVPLMISVGNSGTDTWAETAGVGPASKVRSRDTRLVARWIQVAGADGNPVDDAAGAPEPVVLARVPLAPGRQIVARASIQAPATTGRWAIVVDVEDDIDGSYASLGSRPGSVMLSVVDAPAAFDAPGSATAFVVLDDDTSGGTGGG
jgi:hypothetical protein